MPKYMTQKLLKEYRDQSWTYESFSPNGQLHIVCPHCRAPVLLFENMEASEKAEAVKLFISDMMAALEKLRNASGCEYRTAKGVLMHVRDDQSRCHNCQFAVPPGSLLCPQCMAVNLDW